MTPPVIKNPMVLGVLARVEIPALLDPLRSLRRNNAQQTHAALMSVKV
jgi:hypothetical protein